MKFCMFPVSESYQKNKIHFGSLCFRKTSAAAGVVAGAADFCSKRYTMLGILLVTLLVAAGQADAQILNIERSRVAQDAADYFTGKAAFNFSMFNRNAGRNNPNNFLQLTFDGSSAYVSEQHSYQLLGNLNYLLVNYTSRESRNTVASNGYAHFRVNLLRKRRLSYELFTQYQADLARGLEVRYLTGGGMRYALLREDDVHVAIGSGLMYEHEAWKDPEQEGRLRVADLLKSTNYASIRAKFNEQVGANVIVYYQTGYDHTIARFRNRVSGDVSFDVKVLNRLSLKTNFSCTFEDKPIVPVTKFVYSITNGVQYAF
ncbi:DUF481 domain-containing protein [Botryobacter ruber]|uniref:DUF481 domain-containing protein n=1 Tax=Botryobacter ruber TaxID=2171629 RepID=UPI000E0BDE3F|nr:DUF481 domain-containing protein [Botryobacter ruber]